MTAYTVTVTHGADFSLDLGVTLADGTPLKQVAAMPGALEYTVSSVGVYTFNVAQASAHVLIDYMWEDASAGGSLEIANALMGSTPRFMLVLSQVFEGKTFTLVLYSNVCDKLNLPLKMDDYLIADMSGQAHADDTNRVARITTTSITGGGS